MMNVPPAISNEAVATPPTSVKESIQPKDSLKFKKILGDILDNSDKTSKDSSLSYADSDTLKKSVSEDESHSQLSTLKAVNTSSESVHQPAMNSQSFKVAVQSNKTLTTSSALNNVVKERHSIEAAPIVSLNKTKVVKNVGSEEDQQDQTVELPVAPPPLHVVEFIQTNGSFQSAVVANNVTPNPSDLSTITDSETQALQPGINQVQVKTSTEINDDANDSHMSLVGQKINISAETLKKSSEAMGDMQRPQQSSARQTPEETEAHSQFSQVSQTAETSFATARNNSVSGSSSASGSGSNFSANWSSDFISVSSLGSKLGTSSSTDTSSSEQLIASALDGYSINNLKPYGTNIPNPTNTSNPNGLTTTQNNKLSTIRTQELNSLALTPAPEQVPVTVSVSDQQNHNFRQLNTKVNASVKTEKSQKAVYSESAILTQQQESPTVEIKKDSTAAMTAVLSSVNNNETTDLTVPLEQNISLFANYSPTGLATPFTTDTASAGAAAINQESWQLVSKQLIFAMNGEDQSTTLDLNLPEIGPLKVEIKVNRQLAEATFISTDPAVRQAIEIGLPQLRILLQQSGINLKQTRITDVAAQALQITSKDLKQSLRTISTETSLFKSIATNESVKNVRSRANKDFDDLFNQRT